VAKEEIRAITILSGGQAGADRAALDFAIANGISHSGWCPRGRLAEDGRIDERYLLCQTPSRRYAQRTEWNVRDSDATVVFSICSEVQGGTALTVEIARRLDKPCLHLSQAATQPEAAAVRLLEFLDAHHVSRLNIAGPRASQEPAIGRFVQDVLSAALGD
jgi:hypothetical protein